ncbi:PPAPDC2 [Bugula neritina]|uniref:PPAPDC2 n=1 Tax=Bugula neritina TaxID=10212 RepID=A0A7J7JA69_BUGNE|nr:PPAPDC2 [Bugula neritina]
MVLSNSRPASIFSGEGNSEKATPIYHHSKDFLVSVKIDKKFSFPSGHTTRAIMCGCLLLYSLELSFSSQILVLTWSISTAVSRVMLGRHYVTDVIAGSIFGFLQFYAMVHYLHIDDKICQSIAKHCQSLLSRS